MADAGLAVGWFHREQWSRIRAACVDGQGMPACYDDWLKHAEKVFKQFTAEGRNPRKVYLDIEMLLFYANKNGVKIDANLRRELGAALLLERFTPPG